jgi:hypothetical protein
MSRLRTQYGKVFKKWTGRPDLMKRVRRVLADPSLCEVSVAVESESPKQLQLQIEHLDSLVD